MDSKVDVGSKAPDFTLVDQNGAPVKLSERTAQNVIVLFFYPKDDTTGCTAESVAFTALADDFAKIGAVVIGLSPDSVKSHDKFVKKHNLAVPLAADEEKTVLQAYGVWKEKSMYGKTYMGVERTTVLVGADGAIAQVWNKVKVPGHADVVLAAVKAL